MRAATSGCHDGHTTTRGNLGNAFIWLNALLVWIGIVLRLALLCLTLLLLHLERLPEPLPPYPPRLCIPHRVPLRLDLALRAQRGLDVAVDGVQEGELVGEEV